MQDTVIIVEEVNILHPLCPRCDIMVPWVALNGRHPNTTQCAKGEYLKQRVLEVEEVQAST